MQNDDVTELLSRWQAGDEEARDALIPLIYDQLRQLAALNMAGERRDHILDATDLLHEAWIRMSTGKPMPAASRYDFQRLAARVMRQVLVDYGRKRVAGKRGGGDRPVMLNTALAEAGGLAQVDVVDIALALAELEEQEGREYAEVVELRFFAGLTVAEVAKHQGVGVGTVDRRWKLAKARLYRALSAE